MPINTEGFYRKLHAKHYVNEFGGITSKTYYEKVSTGPSEIISIEDANDTPGHRDTTEFYTFKIEKSVDAKES